MKNNYIYSTVINATSSSSITKLSTLSSNGNYPISFECI